MRGKLAKRLRKHVATRYKFLADQTLYMRSALGTITLAQQCKRAIYQAMKRTYKKRRYYGTLNRSTG